MVKVLERGKGAEWSFDLLASTVLQNQLYVYLRLIRYVFLFKWPVYVFTFGEIISRQVNVGGIQIFYAQFQAMKLR